MGKPKSPCGTEAAYRRHLRHREEPCAACREAHASLRRVSRRSAASSSPVVPPPIDGRDDMTLLVDTLRDAFVKVAAEDPSKLAPIAREFRSVIEAVNGPTEQPKELTLAEQLAEARAARAARAAR